MLRSFSASSGSDQELLSCWPPFPSREKTMQTPLANKYIWQCHYSVIRKAEGWYLYHLLVSVENGNFSFLQRSVQSWAWAWAYGSALRLEGRAFGITLGVDWAQLNQGRPLCWNPSSGAMDNPHGNRMTHSAAPAFSRLGLKCTVKAVPEPDG